MKPRTAIFVGLALVLLLLWSPPSTTIWPSATLMKDVA